MHHVFGWFNPFLDHTSLHDASQLRCQADFPPPLHTLGRCVQHCVSHALCSYMLALLTAVFNSHLSCGEPPQLPSRHQASHIWLLPSTHTFSVFDASQLLLRHQTDPLQPRSSSSTCKASLGVKGEGAQ